MPKEMTDQERFAYRSWMFSGEDPDTGILPEPWEIQEQAFIGGYRSAIDSMHEGTDQ